MRSTFVCCTPSKPPWTPSAYRLFPAFKALTSLSFCSRMK